MKKSFVCFFSFFFFVLFLGSCSEKQEIETEKQNIQPEITPEQFVLDYTTSDFTPPTGKAEGPDDDNPWNSRMLIATSEDGLIWTRKNQLVSDQANVPSAITKDGRIFVYYVSWLEEVRNRAVVAVSSDNGQNWVYKKVIVNGMLQGMRPAIDPSIVLLDDGRFRLYFTSEKPGVGYPEVFSAISDDGVVFTLEDGSRFSRTKASAKVIDPTVLKIDDTWHMYTLYLDGSAGNFHATSSDGLTFTEQESILNGMILSNGILMDGVLRFYGFTHTDKRDMKYSFEIRSWATDDGFALVMDKGTRLQYDGSSVLEKNFVKDPAVVQLDDGTYMMFYISAIPDE